MKRILITVEVQLCNTIECGSALSITYCYYYYYICPYYYFPVALRIVG